LNDVIKRRGANVFDLPTFRDLDNRVAISHHWKSAGEWREDIGAARDLVKIVPDGDKIVDTVRTWPDTRVPIS
jgi:hypothetical protein